MAARLALFIFFTFFTSLPNESSAKSSFKVDLIHSDSPLSPFYHPSATFENRANQAILNSKSRLRYFQSIINPVSTNAIQSPVVPAGGGYLMQFSLGTPAVKILAILDTGSDLIWTQCLPCENCYEQDLPLFNPTKSSTYRNLSCSSTLCEALGERSTCDNGCQYSYSYGDQSFTYGVLAAETLTFGSRNGRPAKIPKMGFGCGHENGGTFSNSSAGLVGLGGGPLSLISQLGSSVDSKFSYCLGHLDGRTSSGSLKFGEDADLPGTHVVTTPRTKVKGRETFYYLTLEDISVGSKKLNIPPGTFDISESGDGGLIIDSGTTLTMLNSAGFDILQSALTDAISLTPVDDPTGDFQLCYDASAATGSKIPAITFHFSGADYVLKPLNSFIQVTESIACLSIVPSDSISIFGNLAQQNYLVGYNLGDDTVSFAPADCSKMK